MREIVMRWYKSLLLPQQSPLSLHIIGSLKGILMTISHLAPPSISFVTLGGLLNETPLILLTSHSAATIGYWVIKDGLNCP